VASITDSCEIGFSRPLFDLSFKVIGSAVRGTLRNEADSSKVAYEVGGALTAHCEYYELLVHSPIDFPIAPNERGYFRLQVPEAERQRAREHLEQEYRLRFPESWSGWTFLFGINDTYVLRGMDAMESLPPALRRSLTK
jgi:hypothetical protein